MEKVDFDHYAEDYENILGKDLKFFGEDKSYFAEYKIQVLLQNLKDTPKLILEYGCGIGRNFPYFIEHFPESDIYGCDISKKSIEIAENLYPKIKFFIAEKKDQEEYLNKFDLVFVTNVLHHVNPLKRNKVLNRINRMLKPNGILVIFEHNPFNPITRYIVKKCPFDYDAVLITPKELKRIVSNSGYNNVKYNFMIFFPAFLKKLRRFEKYMKKIPLGGQYYLISNKVMK